MTQDPRLDIFRTHEYLREFEDFSSAAISFANLTFQRKPDKAKQFDGVIATKRMDINLSIMDVKDGINRLQRRAASTLDYNDQKTSPEEFILDRLSALDPFNKRISEIISEINQIDLTARQNFSGFSFLEFINAVIGKDEEKVIKLIREVITLYGIDPNSAELSAKKFESMIARFLDLPEIKQMFNLYIELEALKNLNKFVIESTLHSIAGQDDIAVEYIDSVFDFFTDPRHSDFVLPETISFVLDLFADHIKKANYEYSTEDSKSPAGRTYAILKGNEANLARYEQRYGDLSLELSAKLRGIEALIRNTPEYIEKTRREKKEVVISNFVTNAKNALSTLGMNVDDAFGKYVLTSKLNEFKNGNIRSFSGIDNFDDLITAVLYLLAFYEGASNFFHAFERHRAGMSEVDIEKLFLKDATRTSHGVFLDDRKIAIAFILTAPKLREVLTTQIDYSREFNEEIVVELKEDVGEIYKFSRGQVLKQGTTKRVKLAINHKPGKTRRQTLISIYPLE